MLQLLLPIFTIIIVMNPIYGVETGESDAKEKINFLKSMAEDSVRENVPVEHRKPLLQEFAREIVDKTPASQLPILQTFLGQHLARTYKSMSVCYQPPSKTSSFCVEQELLRFAFQSSYNYVSEKGVDLTQLHK